MVSSSVPPAVIPDELAPAFDRFRHRVDTLTARLSEGLVEIHTTHGLTYGELLQTHRELRRLATENRAPSSNTFWNTTAYPRSQMLVTAARPLIRTADDAFADATERLGTSVELAMDQHAGLSAIAPGLLRRMIDVGGTVVLTAMPDRADLDLVGERWHRRLRRAAWRTVVPSRLAMSTAALEDRVDRIELELLDQLPWAHGDRLLSAFELAHVDVRTLLREAVTANAGDPADRLLTALEL